MAGSDRSPLQQLVARVRRRLVAQQFVGYLLWCSSGSLLLAALWFVGQRYVDASAAIWLRFGVAGGVLFLGVLLAAALALVRAPSGVTAALLLDEKFGLKERVTTCLTLTPEQQASAAGQALLADVRQRVGRLDIGSRFPLQVSWTTALVPTSAAVLAVAALFYQPAKSWGHMGAQPGPEGGTAAANAPEIEQKISQLKRQAHEHKPLDKALSEDLKRIEAELDKIAARPHATKEEVRERIKELTALEEQLKGRQNDLADRSEAMQKQFEQLNRLARKQGIPDGPGKELQKALSEGNLEKAKEEVDRLRKKLKNKELTGQDAQQLAKQMKDLRERLQRLTRHKDQEEQLKRLHREGKLDEETLRRELDRLKQDAEKLKDLEKLARQLEDCQECLQKGDGEGADRSLREASEQLKRLDLEDKELDRLSEDLQRLQEAKDACARGMREKQSDASQQSAGGGQPTPAQGRRPLGKKQATASVDSRVRAGFDAKGEKIFDGYAPGENFKKKTAAEIAGDVKQASQEAPETIEQQRIPKAARDMAKGYFRNLSGQKDKEPAPRDK